jgi:hypothetical protein
MSRVCHYTLPNPVLVGVEEAIASNISVFRGRSGRMPYLRPENEKRGSFPTLGYLHRGPSPLKTSIFRVRCLLNGMCDAKYLTPVYMQVSAAHVPSLAQV